MFIYKIAKLIDSISTTRYTRSWL